MSIVAISDNQSSIKSFGTAHISLENLSKFKFHVANLNIQVDGILGNDFMTKFKISIYVQSKTMRIRDRTYKLFYIGKESKKSENDQFIGQRSETVITCASSDIQDGYAIIEKQQISNDVSIPNALVTVKNNKFLITCVNSSNEDKVLSIPHIHATQLTTDDELINDPNYPINLSNTVNNNNNINKFDDLIRRDHLNIEERDSLGKIVKEFSDIFYTEGEPLTFTNHAKHSIPNNFKYTYSYKNV